VAAPSPGGHFADEHLLISDATVPRWRLSPAISIPAIFNQLPCLGMYWKTTRRSGVPDTRDMHTRLSPSSCSLLSSTQITGSSRRQGLAQSSSTSYMRSRY
jgi:hypothetical protein